MHHHDGEEGQGKSERAAPAWADGRAGAGEKGGRVGRRTGGAGTPWCGRAGDGCCARPCRAESAACAAAAAAAAASNPRLPTGNSPARRSPRTAAAAAASVIVGPAAACLLVSAPPAPPDTLELRLIRLLARRCLGQSNGRATDPERSATCASWGQSPHCVRGSPPFSRPRRLQGYDPFESDRGLATTCI